MPEAHAELSRIAATLEAHYRDMQDVEFTVQEGTLYMLQTRTGKRTAEAALKIAVDMVGEGLIDKRTAVGRVDPSALDQLLHPTLDPDAPKAAIAVGLAASPGAATGEVGLHRRRGREAGRRGPRGDPGAQRDQPRGHSRHACGQGHSDGARRHDQPCRRGGARHGPALRLRRRHAQDRCGQGHHDGRQRNHRSRRGHHPRRQHRPGVQGQGADAPARTHGRFRNADGLGRFHPYTESTHQCGHARKMRRRRASSAPKASGCAAPNTCSSRPSGLLPCAR